MKTSLERPTLFSINLDVLLGSLAAVVGGTREGKTSLIYKVSICKWNNIADYVIILLVALTAGEVVNGHPALSPASGPGPASIISIPSERIYRPEIFYGRHHPFSRLQILAVCLIGGLVIALVAATCILHKRTALPPQPMPTTSLTSLPPVTMAIGVPSPFHFGPFGLPSAVAEAGPPQEQPVTEIEMQPQPREWVSAD